MGREVAPRPGGLEGVSGKTRGEHFEQRTDVEGSGRACPSTSQHIQHAGWNRNPSISLGRKGWMVAWEGGAVQW